MTNPQKRIFFLSQTRNQTCNSKTLLFLQRVGRVRRWHYCHPLPSEPRPRGTRRLSPGCPLGANALVKERDDELIVIFTILARSNLAFACATLGPDTLLLGIATSARTSVTVLVRRGYHCPSASHLAVTSDGGALWAKVGGALSVAEGVLVAEYKVTSGFLLCNSYQHDFMSHPNTDMSGAGQSQPAPTKAE